MSKNLQKQSGDQSFVLDKNWLNTANIAADTEQHFSVRIDPATTTSDEVANRRERIDQIMERVVQDYGRALTKLSK